MGSLIRPGAMMRRLNATTPHLRAATTPLPPEMSVLAGLSEAAGCASDVSLVDRARALYVARRRRDTMLGAAARLFHDPAWDIMLDLFIRGEDQQIISVSSACVGACVAHTTALRCLKMMERKGVVTFRRDPFDKRRCFVNLTIDAHSRMAAWLAEL